jgi:hypothetical protein
MAYLIEPVTHQRDNQARLINDSRKVSLLLGYYKPLGVVALGLLLIDCG